MAKQVVLEVTQPFHKSGTEVLYQPGTQFPLGTELPQGISVREVVADVPDEREGKPPAKRPAKAVTGSGGMVLPKPQPLNG